MSEKLFERVRRQQPRQLLYHFGSRMAIPFPILKAVADTVDVAGNPSDFVKRRKAARETILGSQWRDRMSRQSGFASFAATEVPGSSDVVETCRKILKQREQSISELDPRVTFHKLLTGDDIRSYPLLLEFALSEPLIHTVTDYLGTLPRLHDINLWLSPPVDQLRSSHYYHLDKPEVSFIGAFVNVFDVKPEDGPLTILPADISATVERKTDYHRRYILGPDARINDSEMTDHIRENEEVVFTGKAGEVNVFDTSRCFHYGSRCKHDARVMLQIRYALAHKLPGRGNAHPGNGEQGGDTLRNLLLAGFDIQTDASETVC
jgi:hypothetical protein